MICTRMLIRRITSAGPTKCLDGRRVRHAALQFAAKVSRDSHTAEDHMERGWVRTHRARRPYTHTRYCALLHTTYAAARANTPARRCRKLPPSGAGERQICRASRPVLLRPDQGEGMRDATFAAEPSTVRLQTPASRGQDETRMHEGQDQLWPQLW